MKQRKPKQPRLLPRLEPIREHDALSIDDLTTRYRCQCGSRTSTGIRLERHNLHSLRFGDETTHPEGALTMPGNTDLTREGRRLTAAERRPKVIVYRMSGASTRDIAAKLGCSHTTIRNDLNASYQKFAEQESAKTAELRALESVRLDKLQSAVWVQALAGDFAACHVVLGIMDQRARLFALNKPAQLRMLVEDGTKRELEAVMNRLATRLDEATFRTVLEALA